MVLAECCGVYPLWLDGGALEMSVKFTTVAGLPRALLMFFLIDCGEMGINVSKSGYGFVHFCSQFNRFSLWSLGAPLLNTQMLNPLDAFENLIGHHYERSCFVSGRAGAAFSRRRIINKGKTPLHSLPSASRR